MSDSGAEAAITVHSTALVDAGARVGDGTRVWAFTHILTGAVVGAGCNICDHVFIEGGVRVGDRVTVKSGVQLWNGITLEDDVFVGPNATFTNDLFPRSRVHPEEFAHTLVRKGASIGANATVLAGRTIGVNAMIGAGAVVTQDVPPNAIVMRTSCIGGLLSGAEQGVGLLLISRDNRAFRRLVAAELTRSLAASLGPMPGLEFWMVSRRNERDVPRIAAVRRFLLEEMARLRRLAS